LSEDIETQEIFEVLETQPENIEIGVPNYGNSEEDSDMYSVKNFNI